MNKTIILVFIILITSSVIPAQTAAELLKKCEAYNDTNHDKQALEFCGKAIAADPKSEEAYFNRAIVYQRQQNFAAAIADQTTLIGMTGYAMFYVYRADLYLKQGKSDDALADLNTAIAKKPTGTYGARAHYLRGTIYEARGDKTKAVADYESANRLIPNHYESNRRITVLKPAQAGPVKLPALRPPSAPTALTAPAAAAPKTPAIIQPAVKTAWPRMELQGTGLSVESPQPFKLVQDKPDPLIEEQSANVFWTLSYNGIFANVRYVKTTDGKTPRADLEFSASLSPNSGSPSAPRVVDTTFLGKPAVKYEETYVDTYDPKKPTNKRLMIAFGAPGEITSFQMNYPAGDSTAAATADRIFRSLQTGGAVIAATPKMPPANWRFQQLDGLTYEVPSTETEEASKCAQKYRKMPAYDTTAVCYKWNGQAIAEVAYRRYYSIKPSMKMLADDYVRIMKDIDADSKQNFTHQYSTEAANIPGADEAVKVKVYNGYGTTGDNEDIFFIRRGDSEVWVVHTYEFIRWNFTRDAVTRIIGSLTF
jgi:hypothetical protein